MRTRDKCNCADINGLFVLVMQNICVPRAHISSPIRVTDVNTLTLAHTYRANYCNYTYSQNCFFPKISQLRTCAENITLDRNIASLPELGSSNFIEVGKRLLRVGAKSRNCSHQMESRAEFEYFELAFKSWLGCQLAIQQMHVIPEQVGGYWLGRQSGK